MGASQVQGPFLPANFLALPPEMSDADASRFIVLPVPYDGTASFRTGAREGPRAIIEASWQLEDFDPELGCEPCRSGIHTLPELEPHVGNPEAMAQRVAAAVRQAAGPERVVVTLGGEHSLSIGAVQALRGLYPDLSVLILDAHADMRSEYQGSAYSHACTARRIIEMCPIVLVGTRSMSQEEHRYILERQVPLFPLEPASSVERMAQDVLAHLGPNVYISVDLDVLDPGIMPAVATPEPGGMGWQEALALLRGVTARRRVVGFDLMELTPREGPSACAYTAARLAYKLMGYIVAGPPAHAS
jgi:agmatinase